jgi:hypothetical protein
MVSGRVFTDELLSHIRTLCQTQPRPSGNALAREVCAQLDWRSPNGRWAISSCKVALRKLHKRGLIALPCAKRAGILHRLRPSGQPLPAVKSVPAQVEQVPGLHLRLISGADDPLSALWNDLMIAQHPCGDAPLVGAQLRYLIGSDLGWLGALGFGPAAWILGARDEWIGWSVQARKHNLPQVLGLARLLIRREVHCANLASKALALALARLPEDWQARYGVRPLLLETFVDRNHHDGHCFLAANWRRVGCSQGRGRLGPLAPTKSLKDIFLFPLHDQARRLLQTEPPQPVTPRPLLESLSTQNWWAEELDGLDLGDQRLERRAQAILAARAQRPSDTFYGSFDDRHQSKRAYGLIAHPNPQITLGSLLRPHTEATLRRSAAQSVVLLPQDTTSLNYSGLLQTTGLGYINTEGSRGLLLHGLLAWQPDGVPLGILHAHCWARSEAPPQDRRQRNNKSIDEKESLCWLEALRTAASAACRLPHTAFVTLADRGGDLYELHDLVQAGPPNLHAVVRAQHDRNLQSHQKLWAFMADQPVGKRTTLEVPRHTGHPARTATVEVRWAKVTILPPEVHSKKTWPPLDLWAVWVLEPQPPAGVEPLEWMLLTDLPVENWAQAQEKIQWYRRRWGNEEWHRMLKSGCGAERREFTTAQHLERELAFELILAWRVLLMVKLGRTVPDLPAQALFARDELEVLWYSSKKKRDEPVPSLTLQQAIRLMARLVGWRGAPSDKEPGAESVEAGLRRLNDMVCGWRLHKAWVRHQSRQRRNKRA